MDSTWPSGNARDAFDDGFQREIDAIYDRDDGDLFEDHRAAHGWVTGYLGDPFAPVWFVAENPSLTMVGNIEARDGDPTPERQWTVSRGDKLFRRMLVKHGFKDGPAYEAGGWRCYITDVIKAAAFVKDHRLKSNRQFMAAAEAWAPALRWELEHGQPLVVVSVGDKARRALTHLIKTEMIPTIPSRCHIPHYVYIAQYPDNKRKLPGGHQIRVDEYEQQFADIAHHPALVSSTENVVLRVSDGREVDLGPADEVRRAFGGIGDATGGSSGGGRWSYLLGYVPTGEILDPEDADRVAAEARDFKMALHGRLTDATELLLDRIASLAERPS